MTIPRKRGRPRKFSGVKDGKQFPDAVSSVLPMVVAFLVEWQSLEKARRGTNDDRYQQALATIAAKHGVSVSSLERRYRELKWLAKPVAECELRGSAWLIHFDDP